MSGTDKLAGESVVARADALMQRRLAHTATPLPALELPVLTEAIPDLEDGLPILTQVADERESSAQPDPELMERLLQEFTRRVHKRIAAELPSLVEAALQVALSDLSRELQQGLTETTEGAIRDFLQEQRRKHSR
ncbi:MAG: hypothetical protein ACM3SV_14075 [Betaproteobacteria bacterium]